MFFGSDPVAFWGKHPTFLGFFLRLSEVLLTQVWVVFLGRLAKLLKRFSWDMVSYPVSKPSVPSPLRHFKREANPCLGGFPTKKDEETKKVKLFLLGKLPRT